MEEPKLRNNQYSSVSSAPIKRRPTERRKRRYMKTNSLVKWLIFNSLSFFSLYNLKNNWAWSEGIPCKHSSGDFPLFKHWLQGLIPLPHFKWLFLHGKQAVVLGVIISSFDVEEEKRFVSWGGGTVIAPGRFEEEGPESEGNGGKTGWCWWVIDGVRGWRGGGRMPAPGSMRLVLLLPLVGSVESGGRPRGGSGRPPW